MRGCDFKVNSIWSKNFKDQCGHPAVAFFCSDTFDQRNGAPFLNGALMVRCKEHEVNTRHWVHVGDRRNIWSEITPEEMLVMEIMES